MPDIEIRFRDGSLRQFKHQGRPGGSYTKTLTFDGEFVIVTDEWGVRTVFSASDITEIVERPHGPVW